MDRDTEKSMEEKVRKNPPIYKRKLFIAGSIVIAALIGAVISSIIFAVFSSSSKSPIVVDQNHPSRTFAKPIANDSTSVIRSTTSTITSTKSTTSVTRLTITGKASITNPLSCGTRPWKNVKSYDKPDNDGNSETYLRKTRKKRVAGGNEADFAEWPWQVSLGEKVSEECNCNEIKIKLLDINAKGLNKAIFGRYKVSSKVVNNRETYTSVIGAYMVWFNGKDWNLGYRKDLGSEKSLISLSLKNTPNFNSARTFAWNASGINFWDTKSEKIQVKVTCSSKIGWFRLCGGVILNENWIVTAAHCLKGRENHAIYVRMGEYNMATDDEPLEHSDGKIQDLTIHNTIHPDYHIDNQNLPINDIGLLKLQKPIEFQDHIMPICMPQDGADFAGETGWVTGWGNIKHDVRIRPTILREVDVKIHSNDQCQKRIDMFNISITKETSICTMNDEIDLYGKKSSCEGDSGGPLVVQGTDGKFILAGITSIGISGCSGYIPSIYTRVSEYRNWINSVINDDSL